MKMSNRLRLTDICQPEFASWGVAFWPHGNSFDRNGYRELVINLGRKEYTLTLWKWR